MEIKYVIGSQLAHLDMRLTGDAAWSVLKYVVLLVKFQILFLQKHFHIFHPCCSQIKLGYISIKCSIYL